MPSYAALLPVGTEYLRMPIHDHGLPAKPAAMTEILAFLAQSLRAGRRLSALPRRHRPHRHGCRLSAGRAGRPGVEALEELKRLWQQSARARSGRRCRRPRNRPTTSATGRPRSRSRAIRCSTLTLAAARGLRERFLGALLGLAVGDAVAAATQYRRAGRFAPVGDLIGGGPFDLPRGAWSDDTAMALCLAESLLERDGFDARDQVQR